MTPKRTEKQKNMGVELPYFYKIRLFYNRDTGLNPA
jgi:hypothetical protein